MTVRELMTALSLECLTGEVGLDNEVKGGHVGDLLSYVMAHAREKELWVTIQGHINSVAVASLTGVSVIILSGRAEADKEMLEKAIEEEIPVLTAPLSSFAFCMQCSQWL